MVVPITLGRMEVVVAPWEPEEEPPLDTGAPVEVLGADTLGADTLGADTLGEVVAVHVALTMLAEQEMVAVQDVGPVMTPLESCRM